MLHDSDLVSLQEVRTKVELAWAAWQHYQHFDQEQVDSIVEAVAAAGREHALELAQMAVQETGYGNVKDKLAKNLLNADLLPRSLRGMKTVGVLGEIPEKKITEIGVPMGVVAAILPTTNPTSTAIYKTIISLKAGNAVVMSPHPRAKNCTCYTADILMQAATAAGAPEGIIQCVTNSTIDGTSALIRHPRVAVILATGGHGMVKAAYSSGKPAFGVGPGNVPVLVDDSYDVADCVAKVVAGKSFDYGTVCSSEQTLVATESRRGQVLEQFRKLRAYVCTGDQAKALEKLLFGPGFRVNADCVGQSPTKIASMAGFEVPADTSILVAEIKGVGREHPLSAEKLSPVLAVMFVKDFDAGVKACADILRFGGLGHTCVIFSNDPSNVRAFGLEMPAYRVLVNTSAPQGSTGITTGVQPAMTLGCGAIAGNSTSDNVSPLHLINIKRIAWAIRSAEEALTIPDDVGTAAKGPATCPSKTCSFQAAPSAAGTASLATRDQISQAVEKYLASRGIGAQAPRQSAPAAPPAAPQVSAPAAASLAGVVDRFLAGRRPIAPAPSYPNCPVAPDEPASPAPAAAPPQPKVEIVDFVCEADVRAAASKGRKIFIGPKTIVTPAARELGATMDIIVVAER